MAREKFSKVEDMIEYLHAKGANHKMYYHYTNLDSAINIIKSGYWHLSLGDAMNDKQELTKGTSEKWDKTYISSFAYGNGENMAMWGLYGLPWKDAIRIGIPGTLMKEWVNDVESVFLVNKKIDNSFSYENEMFIKPVITDVAYVSGKNNDEDYRIVRDRDTICLTNERTFSRINNLDKITGYIKNAAWSYENEVRIKVELRERIENRVVAIEIPRIVQDNLELTAGPWITDDLYNLIHQRLLRQNCNFEFRKYKYSSFRKMVELRNVCSYCMNTFEQR